MSLGYKSFKQEGFKGRERIILPITSNDPLPQTKKKPQNELCTKYNIRNYVLIFFLSKELSISTKYNIIYYILILLESIVTILSIYLDSINLIIKIIKWSMTLEFNKIPFTISLPR